MWPAVRDKGLLKNEFVELMKLSITLFAVLGLVKLAIATNYDITWYSTDNCDPNGGRIKCPTDAFECCEAPPGYENFRTVQAHSSGFVGALVQTARTRAGGCGRCQETLPTESCFPNYPFKTGWIAEIPLSDCANHQRLTILAMGSQQEDKQADNLSIQGLQEQDSEADDLSFRSPCKRRVQASRVGLGSREYHITDENRHAIIADLINLRDKKDEFVAKWGHMDAGPSVVLGADSSTSNSTTTSASTTHSKSASTTSSKSASTTHSKSVSTMLGTSASNLASNPTGSS